MCNGWKAYLSLRHAVILYKLTDIFSAHDIGEIDRTEASSANGGPGQHPFVALSFRSYFTTPQNLFSRNLIDRMNTLTGIEAERVSQIMRHAIDRLHILSYVPTQWDDELATGIDLNWIWS